MNPATIAGICSDKISSGHPLPNILCGIDLVKRVIRSFFLEEE
jgi:hypothetical protein